ncbi:MAG: ABC transporter permease [Neorhizobium sp.]|nr:ABC transporter permease [Neorhizobium sp.]
MRPEVDKLGVVIAFIAGATLPLAPFAVLKPNRILQGQAKSILEALPPWSGWALAALILAAVVIALLRTKPSVRLIAAAIVLIAILTAIGLSATFLTPAGNTYARVSPASGFWLLLFSFALLAADAIARLSPPPWLRLVFLAVAGVVLAVFLMSGLWSGLSIMKEFSGRADVFWAEATKHVMLALGSLVAATIVGLPLGIVCHRVPAMRDAVLNTLNLVQTIPSIALFGILIAPLAWIAATVPGAAAIGIRGIGLAPAFVALFLYSLLPVVSNTVVGLAGVPRDANDAARGIGMTDRQRLFQVELPLALPVILTGIRIVLVQNIGLATIAALIGGGGFGVFVFQGIGQTAMDLVLLGAVPTVALAFASAVILDALIDMNTTTNSRVEPA